MDSNWDILLSVWEILYHQKNVKYLINNFYIDSVLKMILFWDLLGQDVIKINSSYFFFFNMVHEFARATLAKYHNQTKYQQCPFIFSQFWRLEAWGQGISSSSEETLSGCSLAFSKPEGCLRLWGQYPMALWWWWQSWQALNCLWDQSSLLWKDNVSGKESTWNAGAQFQPLG